MSAGKRFIATIEDRAVFRDIPVIGPCFELMEAIWI